MADEREVNPYESPRASLDEDRDLPGVTAFGVWREGSRVVVHHEARLPQRCVMCNRTAERHTVSLKHHGIPMLEASYCSRHFYIHTVIPYVMLPVLLSYAVIPWTVDFQAYAGRNLTGLLMSFQLVVTVTAFLVSWSASRPEVKVVDEATFSIEGCGKWFIASLPTREEAERDG